MSFRAAAELVRSHASRLRRQADALDVSEGRVLKFKRYLQVGDEAALAAWHYRRLAREHDQLYAELMEKSAREDVTVIERGRKR